MVYSNNVSELQTSNNQSLTDIQNLQQIELNLFTNLEQGIANGTLTPAQQTQMVNKINEISQMRINLYSNMSNMSGFYADNLSASVNILGQQKQTITIVEKELNEAKQRLKAVQQQKNNNLRLVEINTYYGQRYNDHASMMKWIILICVPIILLAFLNKNGILPTGIYSALLVVILVVSLIFLWWKFIYLISHDNMNYQEYTWTANTASYPTINTDNPDGLSNPWTMNVGLGCIGQACCSTGTTYSSSANQCLPSSSSSPTSS
jgi:hypothetical protein